KNRAVVTSLRPGCAVQPIAVEGFVAELAAAPFRTLAATLIERNPCSPCPICRRENSRLDVFDHVGQCYGCGTVRIDDLYGSIYADRPSQLTSTNPLDLQAKKIARESKPRSGPQDLGGHKAS